MPGPTTTPIASLTASRTSRTGPSSFASSPCLCTEPSAPAACAFECASGTRFSRCPAASWRTAAPERKPSAERSGEAVFVMEIQLCLSLAACALQLLVTAGRTSCLYCSPRRLVYLSSSSLLRPPAHATRSCGRCRPPRLPVQPLPPSSLLQTTALRLLLSRAQASPPQVTA